MSFVLIGAVLATSNALVSVAVALAVMSVFAFLSSSLPPLLVLIVQMRNFANQIWAAQFDHLPHKCILIYFRCVRRYPSVCLCVC